VIFVVFCLSRFQLNPGTPSLAGPRHGKAPKVLPLSHCKPSGTFRFVLGFFFLPPDPLRNQCRPRPRRTRSPVRSVRSAHPTGPPRPPPPPCPRLGLVGPQMHPMLCDPTSSWFLFDCHSCVFCIFCFIVACGDNPGNCASPPTLWAGPPHLAGQRTAHGGRAVGGGVRPPTGGQIPPPPEVSRVPRMTGTRS